MIKESSIFRRPNTKVLPGLLKEVPIFVIEYVYKYTNGGFFTDIVFEPSYYGDIDDYDFKYYDEETEFKFRII